jgi:hypothetical protein
MRIIFFLFLTFLACSILQAQTEKGIGISTLSQKLGVVDMNRNYRYSAQSIQFFFGNSFYNSGKWSIDWELNPQFGLSAIKDQLDTEGRHGFEFGVVPYLLVSKRWSSMTKIFFSAGIGPMFISDAPDRQKKGYVFSNNIFLGTRFRISEALRLELRIGARHQSNANFGVPNRGINAYTIGTGLFFNS